jgi:hypothetical protein
MVTDAIINKLHGEFYTNLKSHTIQNIRYQLP